MRPRADPACRSVNGSTPSSGRLMRTTSGGGRPISIANSRVRGGQDLTTTTRSVIVTAARIGAGTFASRMMSGGPISTTTSGSASAAAPIGAGTASRIIGVLGTSTTIGTVTATATRTGAVAITIAETERPRSFREVDQDAARGRPRRSAIAGASPMINFARPCVTMIGSTAGTLRPNRRRRNRGKDNQPSVAPEGRPYRENRHHRAAPYRTEPEPTGRPRRAPERYEERLVRDRRTTIAMLRSTGRSPRLKRGQRALDRDVPAESRPSRGRLLAMLQSSSRRHSARLPAMSPPRSRRGSASWREAMRPRLSRRQARPTAISPPKSRRGRARPSDAPAERRSATREPLPLSSLPQETHSALKESPHSRDASTSTSAASSSNCARSRRGSRRCGRRPNLKRRSTGCAPISQRSAAR